MTITDKAVLRLLKTCNNSWLKDDLEWFEEEERNGRTDAEIVLEESEYYIECRNEDGHSLCEELEMARDFLKETKQGTVMKVNPFWSSEQFSKQRTKHENTTRECKAVVNEYNRTKRMIPKLREIVKGR